MSKIKSTCQHCGMTFAMGYTGTINGCDNCTGVKRSRGGDAWYPGEETQLVQSVATGKRYTKKRPKVVR